MKIKKERKLEKEYFYMLRIKRNLVFELCMLIFYQILSQKKIVRDLYPIKIKLKLKKQFRFDIQLMPYDILMFIEICLQIFSFC